MRSSSSAKSTPAKTTGTSTTAVARSTTTAKPPTTAAPPTTAKPTTTAAPTTAARTTAAPASVNLQQIAAGNYSSLLGMWREEAHAANRHDGSGDQWQSGGPDTLTVTGTTITNGDVVLQGSTLTLRSGSTEIPSAITFHVTGRHLEATRTNESVAINWRLGFYPKGSVNVDSTVSPNNGVTLSSTENTIYIWTSNNDYAEVFTQMMTAPGGPGLAPPSSRVPAATACLTKDGFTSVLAEPGIRVAEVVYCGQGWALAGAADCTHAGCDAGNEVFHAVGGHWTRSSKDAVCDFAHNGAESPIPPNYRWFCTSG